MKFRDYFDRVRIVSLPYRHDRRREVTAELEKHCMPLGPGKVEFFDAIRPDSDGGFDSIGARGCFLSHLQILRESRDAGLSRILILEDDVQLISKFDSYQESLVEQLEGQPWDMVYLGHIVPAPRSSKPTLSPVEPTKPMMLTHCYGVNASVFDRLISFLETLLTRPPGHPDGGPMHVDGAYSRFRAQDPNVVTLIASPNLARQRSSRTDIQAAGWLDRTPLVRDLVGVAREVKSWVNTFK